MTTLTIASAPAARTDWVALARELAPGFATRAAAHDADDSFVAENYAELRRRHVFSAPVPAALGGGDASYAELCDLLRALAHGCSSTALALAMHMHPVSMVVRRWRDGATAGEPFLRRLAAEELTVVSSGGSDFLAGSGTAEPAEGGFRVSGHKRFGSGGPAGDVLMTTAVLADPAAGPTVLHFSVPMRGPGVRIVETWRTLGMRGTGSHDIVLDRVFVPEGAVSIRRPAGRWSPPFHLIYAIALPMIYSVYLGVAEAARALALREAQKRRDDPLVQVTAGEMETELATARMAVADMVAATTMAAPGPETTNRVAIGRGVCGRAAVRAVELAMELGSGGAFYRSLGLERLFRDVQAARYHPLQRQPQHLYAGRLALGLGVDQPLAP
ncbi:MAG TPA: acyl-CoA dehydrogenase family protein [Candidatus Binatia bacterium]|nr:acyl-CoA dehydrogenase family protein [Candidatus Binatia bacterium]